MRINSLNLALVDVVIFFNDIHFDSSWSARLRVNRAACSLLHLKSCNIVIPLWMQQIRFKNHYRNAICRLPSACSSVERFPNYWRPSQPNDVLFREIHRTLVVKFFLYLFHFLLCSQLLTQHGHDFSRVFNRLAVPLWESGSIWTFPIRLANKVELLGD